MSYKKLPDYEHLFDEKYVNVEKFHDFMETALWLYDCRHAIWLKDKPSNEEYEEYQTAVFRFCEEWDKHYKEHKEFYHTQKFYKALAAQARLEQVQFRLKKPKDFEDVTDNVRMNTLGYTMPELKRIYEGDGAGGTGASYEFKDYQALVNKTVNTANYFKDGLWELAGYHAVREIFYVVFLKNKRQKEFIEDWKDVVKLRNAGNTILFDPPKSNISKRAIKSRRIPYATWLQNFGINKITFNDYVKNRRGDADYDKRFAINLAFAFYMNEGQAHKLLRRLGYTWDDSLRTFDELTRKAFLAGQPREYLIARIEKYNKENPKMKINNI